MAKQDLLFRTEAGVFSYRVAGILIRDGKVLLQHLIHDPTYALPGGHVNFGEVSEAALVREFKEEVAADIRPVRLLWIGENFFPWGEQDCHQICLYYVVTLCDETQIPLDGNFCARDELEGKTVALEFCWMGIAALEGLQIYPVQAKDKLLDLSDQIERFVYVEDPGR